MLKARKWSSQSEDSEASENEQFRGGKHHHRQRPGMDSLSARGRGQSRHQLGVTRSTPGSRGGRSYEASESDQSETNLFPRIKSTKRTMSEGSGTETESELDKLPDLAQGLFQTIGEAKKSSVSDDDQLSPYKSPSSTLSGREGNGDGLKFATVAPGSSGEFAASRAVGKYRQRQAANEARQNSVPPQRPPPPKHAPSIDINEPSPDKNDDDDDENVDAMFGKMRPTSSPGAGSPPSSRKEIMNDNGELEPYSETQTLEMEEDGDEANKAPTRTPSKEDEFHFEPTPKFENDSNEIAQIENYEIDDDSAEARAAAAADAAAERLKYEELEKKAKEFENELFPLCQPIFETVSPSQQDHAEISSSYKPQNERETSIMGGNGRENQDDDVEESKIECSSAITFAKEVDIMREHEHSRVETETVTTSQPDEIMMEQQQQYPHAIPTSPAPTVTFLAANEQETEIGVGRREGEEEEEDESALNTRPPQSLSASQPLPPFSCSPGGSQSTSPSGLSYNNAGRQMIYQQPQRFKSLSEADMGSSTDSGTRQSYKSRLDLPSQRTLSEEEDTRSTHSYRSSRVSSRRQSTEESIDSEDEWYKYELRKLEELERQQIAAAETQPPTGPQVQLRFTQYTYVTNYHQAHDIPMAATVDMKERMNLVLQELLVKTNRVESHQPGSEQKGLSASVGDLAQPAHIQQQYPPPMLERRLSLTGGTTNRAGNRDDTMADEPLGYVSRRRTSSHEEYDQEAELDPSATGPWNKEDLEASGGAVDFGSMIEPPPADVGLRIGLAIESSKKQQQQQFLQSSGGSSQDTTSVRSSESAFYSGGSSAEFTKSSRDSSRTTDERPSISLPSSSSMGDNAWQGEGKMEETYETERPTTTRGGDSSGETSGPDTPQESFEEDEQLIAKEEEMMRAHQARIEQEEYEREEAKLAEEEQRERLAEEQRRRDSVEEHEHQQEDQSQYFQEEYDDILQSHEDGGRHMTEEECTMGPLNDEGTRVAGGMSEESIPLESAGTTTSTGGAPGTMQTEMVSGTPPAGISRRESSQSGTFSKLFGMLSMGEVKFFSSDDEQKSGSLDSTVLGLLSSSGASASATTNGATVTTTTTTTTAGSGTVEQPVLEETTNGTASVRSSIPNEAENKQMSKMAAAVAGSMSVDEEFMAEQYGPGGPGPDGGPPGRSKWGFVKTLKEKKAEEKENAAALAAMSEV